MTKRADKRGRGRERGGSRVKAEVVGDKTDHQSHSFLHRLTRWVIKMTPEEFEKAQRSRSKMGERILG